MALKSKFPDLEIPENVSWPDFVLQNFDQYGEKTAIVDGTTGHSYTFSQIRNQVRKCGSAFTKRGFHKGDVFAIFCPNVPEYPIIFFGIAAIGGVATIVNPLYTTEELTYQLQESRARLIVTVPTFAEKAREGAEKTGIETILVLGEAEGCESFSSFLEDDGESFPEKVEFNPKEDLVVLPFSSGTTGLAKGVMLTHYNLVATGYVGEHESVMNVNEDSVVLGVLPFCHIYGMMISMSLALHKGAKVVCMARFEQETFLKVVQEHKITHAALVPPIILFLTKSPLVEKYDLSSLIDITSGAAPMGEELSNALLSRLKSLKWLRQGYGMTELSPVSHVSTFDNSKPGSVGVLLSNLECKVMSVDSGETLGPCQNGEICVKGPTVMKGYLNNPQATADTIDSEGWLHTGDIGHYDEDEHFYIVDRLKELIKYKGYQVPPAELEALLISHPGIEDAAVVGVPDPETGELPKAFVVRKAGETLTENDVIQLVEKHAAPHKKLRGGVEFIEKIPKSSSGKILRRELKAKEFAKAAGAPEEKHVLQSKYQNLSMPDNLSWTEFVFQKFDEYGNKEALVDGTTGCSYTFTQLNDLTKSVASGLARRGFKKGDVLAMYSPNSPEFAIVFFGALRCGGVITSINPVYTANEVSGQLKSADAKWLMTVSSLAHRSMDAAREAGIDPEHILVRGDEAYGCVLLSTLFEDDGSSFPEVQINPKEDVAVLPFSSGTTGMSKGVMLSHYNLVADGSIVCSPGFLDFSATSVILAFLPFYHVYGLVIVLSLALRRGSKIVTMSKFEQERFLQLLQEYRVTHLPIVPPVALFLANHPSVDHYDLSCLTEITCGAAVLGSELSKAVSKRLPRLSRIRQGYGMTELSPVCHMTPFGGGKHGSVGVLLPGLECKVVSVETGGGLDKGQDGEIWVRGPIVMKGYLNNPEATAATIDSEGWLHTGDIGHYDEDEHFYIVDRVKELIKYKGYQVPPAELEALLISHPDIADAAVVGVPDPEAGELPKAFVVRKTDASITEDEIMEFVEENAAPYKKLRGGVEFVDTVPKSQSGKILRRELRDRVNQMKETKNQGFQQHRRSTKKRSIKIDERKNQSFERRPESGAPVSRCCVIA